MVPLGVIIEKLRTLSVVLCKHGDACSGNMPSGDSGPTVSSENYRKPSGCWYTALRAYSSLLLFPWKLSIQPGSRCASQNVIAR
jgi:hypothetical protein